jgi:signal transduction histidine kinase
MTEQESENSHAVQLRSQVLIAAGLSLAAAAVIFAAGAPLPKALGALGLLSAAIYGGYFLVLSRAALRDSRRANSLMGLLGAAILTLAVHFTGGIVSPFVFMFFTVLVTEGMYGLPRAYTLPAITAGYLGVVVGQYAGVLPYSNSWAAEIYGSLPATLLIAGVTVIYLFVMRRLSWQIFEKLNLKLSRERELKDAMMRKFSELNATAQLGVLAHRIAHDMRGPISCIFGYLELEMAKTKAPEDLEVLRGVRETAGAMVESLQGITRFGKQGGPCCESIHLSDMMKDLVAIASFSPLSKGVSFKLDGPDLNNITISACRQDLQQAFFNVVKNAVEAVSGNSDEKVVAIGIERDGQDARVTISDNGPGMSEAALRDVFRKSLTTKSDGTGVGLMITRDLLMRNSGAIKLRNRSAGGLTAEITLPAA